MISSDTSIDPRQPIRDEKKTNIEFSLNKFQYVEENEGRCVITWHQDVTKVCDRQSAFSGFGYSFG